MDLPGNDFVNVEGKNDHSTGSMVFRMTIEDMAPFSSGRLMNWGGPRPKAKYSLSS